MIETSGLADPAPVVTTLARDAWLRAHARLQGVVAVVDAMAGLSNLQAEPEAQRQVAMADAVVVTKTDLRAAVPFEAVAAAVRRLAPDASVFDSGGPGFNPASPFRGGAARPAPMFVADAAEHGAETGSFTLLLPDAVDWPCFTLWLSALLHAHGDRILRVKGVLRSTDTAGLLAIHGVQHVMHPPTHLPDTGGAPTGLVFITRGLERGPVERSMGAFLRMGDQIPAASKAAPTRSTSASA